MYSASLHNHVLIFIRSEGPAQVFLIIVLMWVVAIFSQKMREERKKAIISYDNMCHLDNLRVARKPLPLPGDLQYLWTDTRKMIDSLHIRNHKDTRCRQRYDPMPVKEENPKFNTMSCEQTFAWLERYKKIVVSMGICYHHFYLGTKWLIGGICIYIAFCYANNRRLVQPKVRFTSKK